MAPIRRRRARFFSGTNCSFWASALRVAERRLLVLLGELSATPANASATEVGSDGFLLNIENKLMLYISSINNEIASGLKIMKAAAR
jgi:hypothetical protein